MSENLRCLQENFAFSNFRPGQESVIDCLLAGRSALAIFPTGGGKSLCYQLPALLLDGLTVVISPLIALMKDQVDALRERGIMAARLDSSIGPAEVQTIYGQLADGSLKLLYIAPERLANERFINRLQGRPIALLAIDEAHCISEWGHNFRPEYLKIASLAKELKVDRVLALTATATPEVAADIRRAFDIAETDLIRTSFHRPNLHLTVSPCPAPERRQLLLERLRQQPSGPTIVYVTLQKTAEEIAAFLDDEGVAARAYHAGMKTEDRTAVQEAFMAGDLRVVVATIAFGMGIDKADIRAIYHYNLPKTLENYMQEIGRAGRDGKDAHCEILACVDDLTVLANFSYGDTPVPEALSDLVKHLLRQGETFDVAHYELAGLFDIRPLVVATIFTYLELKGVLQATGPFYDSYKIRFNRPLDEILAGFDAQRAAFLSELFATARPGRIWSHLNPNESAAALNQPRGVSRPPSAIWRKKVNWWFRSPVCATATVCKNRPTTPPNSSPTYKKPLPKENSGISPGCSKFSRMRNKKAACPVICWIILGNREPPIATTAADADSEKARRCPAPLPSNRDPPKPKSPGGWEKKNTLP